MKLKRSINRRKSPNKSKSRSRRRRKGKSQSKSRRKGKSKSRRKSKSQNRRKGKSRSRSRRKGKSQSRRKGKSQSRRKSKRNDGTSGNLGRFRVKSVINLNEFITKELENIYDDAKLNYNYNIDFTKEKEFKDIMNAKDYKYIKFKFDKYIELVKNSILYPKKEIKIFRQNYLKKLLKLKERLDDIVYLRQKYKRKNEKIVNILPTIDELDNTSIEFPTFTRQSSYENTPYKENGLQFYKHRIDPLKRKIYWKGDKYFYIVDT